MLTSCRSRNIPAAAASSTGRSCHVEPTTGSGPSIPARMQTSYSCASDTCRTQSTRSERRVGCGWNSTTTAPAPSDSIHRRKCESIPARMPSYRRCRRLRLDSSDPTTAARGWSPSLIFDTAASSAARLDAHTPDAESSCIGPPPSRPCTIDAKPGTSASPIVVAVASIRSSPAAMPRSSSAAVSALTASSSLSSVGSPCSSSA